MSGTPELDPASIGISFVDILFALAVGEVFAPVARWATDPSKNPLPLLSWLHLGVALTISITSWLGYHASANKARFQPQFVNVELVKLVLDIAMVAVYFVLAAYAVRQPVETKPETLLVFVAFALYACWDYASLRQKRDPKYRDEWNSTYDDPVRHDVTKPWRTTEPGRIAATLAALTLTAVVWALTWFLLPDLTGNISIAIDVVLFVILIAYRMLKESKWWAERSPAVRMWLVVFERIDAGWSAYPPAMAGVNVVGATREQTKRLAHAIALHLQDLAAKGLPIPDEGAVDISYVEPAALPA